MKTNKYILYFSLFTFLFSLLQPYTALAYGEFPFNGGTTSDSITLSEPELQSFIKLKDKNFYQLEKEATTASIKFRVTVPTGQLGSLEFKRFFKILVPENSTKASTTNITFKIYRDGVCVSTKKNSTESTELEMKSVRLGLSSGPHDISLEVTITHGGYETVGSIDNLSLHVHDYSNEILLAEPICGQVGKKMSICTICSKQQSVNIPSPYKAHKLTEASQPKFSCLSNAGTISKCEQCPYMKIEPTSKLEAHEFDANGQCTVCHLFLPKHNTDTTVYYVQNASEMRVLAEMVSLGRISGNIGVEILNDLVFRNDTIMMPLGTTDNPFRGVLNGNGHRISGITGCYQGTDGLGFVGVAKGTITSHAVISNLIFDHGNNLQGMACVGGIVGYAENCDIKNCASFGTLEGTDYVGGLVGYADQNVTILNCGSVTNIRCRGKWNTMVCGMPHGHIMNSYGDASNRSGGVFDDLTTTTLRHCFCTQGSGSGLKKVSQSMLTSYDMVELLNEESQGTNFTKSMTDLYPIPVVNTETPARSNRAFAKNRPMLNRPMQNRRAADDDDEPSEKDLETVEVNGYIDENAAEKFGYTIEEIMRKDSTEYPLYDLLYVTTRTVPEGFELYDMVSGGEMQDFESYIISEDSLYIALREYELVTADRVKPITVSIGDLSGACKQINEYDVRDGAYTLKSRLTMDNEFIQSADDEFKIIYQEVVNGILKPQWSIIVEPNPNDGYKYTNIYSHNNLTGATRLEYSSRHTHATPEEELLDLENYEEYYDSLDNTIHVIYNYTDSATSAIISREHYILRAEDYYPIEVRIENMTGGTPTITEGMYFIYDEEGYLLQSVSYMPDQRSGELRPYIYYDYQGKWTTTPYTTAIQIPTVKQPTAKERVNPNVYDMQGRIVRRVTDHQDPFSGLPHGLYIYQGKKFIKK